MKRDTQMYIDIVFLIYIAILLKITVFRHGFGTGSVFGGSINTALFTEYFILIKRRQWLRFIYYFLGNTVWFIPLGFYMCHFRKTGFIKAAAAGACLSLLIELTQYIFAVGVSEIDDIILNTFGTAVGYWLSVRVSRLHIGYNGKGD